MTRQKGRTAGLTHPGLRPPQEAVIFDLDGVVTDTARLHARAWTQLFDEALADPRASSTRGGGPPARFDAEPDYRRYVDGRSRQDGVRAVLEANSIAVPEGAPGDPEGAWTVHGLAARKNRIFLELLGSEGVRAFPGTAALVARLRAAQVPVGLVSASRNAVPVLRAVGLEDAFDVVVDGEQAAALGLPGKPDPAMYLRAAEALGVQPSRAAVIEDAVAGVEAARSAGFGLVVGIARAGQRDELEAAGADLVVEDVAQLDLGSLRVDPWLLVYEGFDPAHEGHREALTTLANGYLGTRGAAPERAADDVRYPGTYLAGVYNRLTTVVDGHEREDEHLVNAPNWLPLDVRVEDAAWWSEGGLATSAEHRELDLRRGLLTRTATLTDATGRQLLLTQRRIVSMDRPHLCALETTLVPVGWGGSVEVRASIDTAVVNANVADDAALANRHLRVMDTRIAGQGVIVAEVETMTSHIRIAVAARLVATAGADDVVCRTQGRGWTCVQTVRVDVAPDRPAVVDKTVTVFTSRDAAISSPGDAALNELAAAPTRLQGLLSRHVVAWERLWRRFVIELDADVQTRLVLNLHVFHLLQSLSEHTALLDAGVPARGLHGEGYRGRVFWDELFVLPVLTAHLPAVSRGLLEYRHRRLDRARLTAAEHGLRGALFPWQSGSDGREETPTALYNTRSGRWMPDHSHLQRHVGLAVAYNAWQYYTSTGDVGWLAGRGADLIIEVARLFAAMARYDPEADRFHLHGVMGPDEYHDGPPDQPGAGLTDNAYTNVLAAWVCQRAGDVLQDVAGYDCDEVSARLQIGAEEPVRWEHLSRRLSVPFHDGVISQFAGYETLDELDWARYRQQYGNIGRLDLILEAEGDSTNRYKLAKQADVLMLLYLLGEAGLIEALARLGYPVTHEDLRRSVDYYLPRTAHGSTLSGVVHASVLARMDPAAAWPLFQEALTADLDDTQGGTTEHGIHLGAMAGTIDIVTRSFAGVTVDGNAVTLDPRLPVRLAGARFELQHRGQRLRVVLTSDTARVSADPCAANADVDVRVASRRKEDGSS
ncbi:MAG: beta-phosphoglucomutase family hydrolase [Intrasporangium sp.]|uniref:beta-phosphoglucomutase family hydrolase n=1 Tax=Intrasporangium sp. TaxID=1925024 RepID=UPI0026476C0C|nr:beta-phosphoglucomutase family hydrolase [Intrasporangium sp.]MDN5796783.1 beta-phosphoglucomutase family hydrolase [Intrasporangium sp.]